MNWKIRTIGIAVMIGTASASGLTAQRGQTQSPNAAAMRDLIIQDSLTPTKKQLREVVAELRDTLITVQSLYEKISRNRASGIGSVVLSNGRELGKRCRVAGAMAELTTGRVALMYTNDPHGDQAIAAYRASLAALIDDLHDCQREDSVVMAAAKPDQKRIEDLAASTGDAITRYDAVRDALMKLLSIDLPVSGTIRGNAKRP